MTKRATIILTILVTLAAIAYIKDPTDGQNNISNLINWISPW